MKAYTEEFKIKIVELYNSGKAPSALVKEYGMCEFTDILRIPVVAAWATNPLWNLRLANI